MQFTHPSMSDRNLSTVSEMIRQSDLSDMLHIEIKCKLWHGLYSHQTWQGSDSNQVYVNPHVCYYYHIIMLFISLQTYMNKISIHEPCELYQCTPAIRLKRKNPRKTNSAVEDYNIQYTRTAFTQPRAGKIQKSAKWLDISSLGRWHALPDCSMTYQVINMWQNSPVWSNHRS